MSTENKIYVVSDVEFSEEERIVINSSVYLFNGDDTPTDALTYVSKILNKAIVHSFPSKNKKLVIQSALNKISARLNKWEVSRETHNIMGQIPSSETGLNNEKYFTIEASNYEEAKAIRDEMEAEYYAFKNIDIKKLISIINNMERSFNSTNISPSLLKQIIKESI